MDKYEQKVKEWQDTMNFIDKAFAEGMAEEMFNLLLTLDERELLGTRVRIFQELMRGKMTQREIREELKVGIATITRGSNSLKLASPKMKGWLEKELL